MLVSKFFDFWYFAVCVTGGVASTSGWVDESNNLMGTGREERYQNRTKWYPSRSWRCGPSSMSNNLGRILVQMADLPQLSCVSLTRSLYRTLLGLNFRGDLEAIERVSYELCEDEAKEDVAYFEARYSPHLWSSTEGEPTTKRKVTADEVVEAVSRGLKRGQADFGVKARQILSSISGHGGNRKSWLLQSKFDF